MARGRKTNEAEAAREIVEGRLGKLGNARVLIHLVRDRIQAARMTSSTDFLDVAIRDLEQADRLVRETQKEINFENIEVDT